ncbi:nuclear transport factor 2 family protein [uncultured Microbacterium sp.]|uniref:nuclear transport factor 2 family protein n=1 Tax=uncultured Microbacterium sp. TaxID=191216 RepID=UPI0035CBC9BE
MDTTTAETFVADYLRALEVADLRAVLALFDDSAVVHSPLYGDVAAREFYPRLFADTSSSRLALRTVLRGEDAGAPVIAFWFDFDWTLLDGTLAPFTVVDVARLNREGKIAELHIVYDTAPIRSLFDAATERSGD